VERLHKTLFDEFYRIVFRKKIPFDLLYWNSDSMRMPRAMHNFYPRDIYEHNRLSMPGVSA
jgi:poly(3-hydroxyalkanoate) synthetase